MKSKPFRRAYAVVGTYNYRALADYCHDIVYLVNDRNEPSMEVAFQQMKQKLSGFDPAQDVIIPVHTNAWIFILGWLMGRFHQEVTVGHYVRDDSNAFGPTEDYEFYMLTEEGIFDGLIQTAG